MRRHLFWLGCVLVVLSLAGGANAGDDDEKKKDAALSESEVKRLVAKAASISRPLMHTLVALGEKLSLRDLMDPEGDTPLTAAAIFLLGEASADRRDLRMDPTATPQTVSAALYPTEVQAGRRVPKYGFASLVHSEYVTHVTIEVNGRTATGELGFRAPDVYEGRLLYTAHRDEAGWRVLELRFPYTRLRTTLENGRWRLYARPPKSSGINPLRDREIRLPRLSTVGTEPEEATRVVISVTRDGWIHAGDSKKPLGLVALKRYLAGKTAHPAMREKDGASKLDVLLDVDGSTPWAVCQWLMQTCAHPQLKIYRIWFGARARKDGAEGALLTILPKDRGLAPTPRFPMEFKQYKVKLLRSRNGSPSDIRTFYRAFQQTVSKHGVDEHTKFVIVAPPPYGGSIPFDYVAQVMDVCLALGAHDIIFEGAAMPRGPEWGDAELFKARIDRMKALAVVPMIKINNGPPVGGAHPGAQPVPGRGRIDVRWGAGASTTSEMIEEDVEEVVEEKRAKPKPSSPFEAPAGNPKIGIGGGAGGAFKHREGKRDGTLLSIRARTDAAVNSGLRWLAAHQSPNGSWEAAGFGNWCDGKPVTNASKKPAGPGKRLYDVGVTGLALQAFLKAGYTNRGKHPFAKVVSRGLRYLKNVQDPEGCFGPRSTQQYIYNHAMAAIAMVEAYGMTGSPIFKGSAQRCLDFIALARNPYFAWRYGIKPGDNDTSISGWMFLALNSAKMVNDDAVRRGKPMPLTIDGMAGAGFLAWLGKITDKQTGRVGYTQRGAGPARPQTLVKQFPGDKSESMTAVGVFARIFMGEDPRKSDIVKRGLRLMAKLPPKWSNDGSIDMYYWHWGTLAMWQAGGKHWPAWEEGMVKAILHTQRKDTDHCLYKGSWNPRGPWGPDGGRVYATAMMTLCCEVYYSYNRKFNTGTRPKKK